jgi:hypothetical protein
MHEARGQAVPLVRLALTAGLVLAVTAGCGSDGGGAEVGRAAPAEPPASTAPPTVGDTDEADPADVDAATFTDQCPSAEDLSAPLGITLNLVSEGPGESSFGVVSEFGCTYLPPEGADFYITGYRDRFEDADAAAYEMDVFDFGDPGDANAAGPLDIARDLDLGDGGYANTRVQQRQDGQGYEMSAKFAVRLGARRCFVDVFSTKAPAPGLSPAQEDAAMSVLSALCDV